MVSRVDLDIWRLGREAMYAPHRCHRSPIGYPQGLGQLKDPGLVEKRKLSTKETGGDDNMPEQVWLCLGQGWWLALVQPAPAFGIQFPLCHVEIT